MHKGIVTHWLAAIGGGLTVLAGIATLSARDKIRPAQAVNVAAASSAPSDPSLDELRQRLGRLEQQQAAVPAAAVPVPAPTPQRAADIEQPAANEPAAQDHEHAAVVQAEQVLAKEAVDPNWARQTEGNIQKVFDQKELRDTRLLGARCRSTLCRIELEHSSDEAKQAFILNAATQAPFSGSSLFAHAEPDKPGHFVIYLARQGHSLPQPDDNAPAQ